MIYDDRQLLASPTRQSPIAVVFIALKFVRNLGLVNIGVAVAVLASGRVPLSVLAPVGSLVVTVAAVMTVLAWWRFVFSINGEELLVAKGVFSQERLTIPLDRIQSVSIEQRLLHRVIGLVSVSVDTAGSSSAEFQIDAVDRSRAEALQRLAAGQFQSSSQPGGPGIDPVVRPPGAVAVEPAAGPGEVLVSRTPAELLKIGLTRLPWAGLAALAPLAAVVNELGDLLPFDASPLEDAIDDRVPDEFGPDLLLLIVGLVMLGATAAAILGVVLGVVSELVTNWKLQLLRTSTGFRRTAGLFSTTSRASTTIRIQALQVDENPAQRYLGIRRLTLPTIGDGDLVIPGVTAAELERIRGEISPGAIPPALDRRISPRFVFLAVRNRVLGLVPFLVLGAFTVGWWAALALVLIPLRWLVARRQWRLRWWGLNSDRIIERYELVNRHTAELELIKTQTVQVSRSFFERRRGLATIRINTAEGHLAVPLIPLDEAQAVRDRALFSVETDRRAWM